MLAVIGKIWSIDKVQKNDRTFLRMLIKKKKHHKEIPLWFLICKDEIIELYQNKYFSIGDNIEIKFYIKTSEYADKYYTNLFVEKITLLKEAKNNMKINMFDNEEKDFSTFQ
jgi:hypothetical protein